jgi:5-hydroxyisourate hydrolase-like protein (transthyretin family)
VRAGLTASATALVALLAAPAVANAATMAVSPLKTCYRAGETVGLGGASYTPNTTVQVNSDGRVVGTVLSNAAGNFAGALQLGVPSGERLKTYSAVDTANTANVASVQLRVSRLLVTVKPKNGRPGRILRVKARGFTTGKTLYAHVVRGHKKRNLRIGKLKGACHTLSVRKRIFSKRTKTGTYTVQFDSKRHYSKKRAVRYRFTVPVTARFATASAAAWTPLQ